MQAQITEMLKKSYFMTYSSSYLISLNYDIKLVFYSLRHLNSLFFAKLN